MLDYSGLVGFDGVYDAGCLQCFVCWFALDAFVDCWLGFGFLVAWFMWLLVCLYLVDGCCGCYFRWFVAVMCFV